jgi:predicted RNA binding protein YcfA (HicA-like mRNA interferase family)
MSHLPRLSGRACAKALVKSGYVVDRQKGSHIVLRRLAPFGMVVVPDHPELDSGTLRAIIRQAGLTVENFIALL